MAAAARHVLADRLDDLAMSTPTPVLFGLRSPAL